MSIPRLHRKILALFVLVLFTGAASPRQAAVPSVQSFKPSTAAQKLTYRIDWRMITAGTAVLQFAHVDANKWQISLDLDSAGVVSRLYRIYDRYKVTSDDHFCLSDSVMDAQEGKKHLVTKLRTDKAKQKLSYEQQDLVKNTQTKNELVQVPSCVHEIAGALAALGGMDLLPGKSATLAISDGKKIVFAKVNAQQRESLSLNGKTVPTIRYEAFLLNNVLYKRKGQMYLWLTDDASRTPVQIRLQLAFPIGTVSLQLEKQEAS